MGTGLAAGRGVWRAAPGLVQCALRRLSASPPGMANYATAVEAIAEHNRAHCDIPQVLDALEITVSTVPSLYLYVFELVQNALDIGATRLRFVVDTHGVLVEHNGADFGPTDVHVRGLANVFQSTKSIGSIGFMGFGFKTIYKRFRRVEISDTQGWRFAFDVPESEIELAPGMSVYARHWLGAMLPIWDHTLSTPSEGYSTAFRLTGITSDTYHHPLVTDLREAFFDKDGAALAILATKGLVGLDLVLPDGQVRVSLQKRAQGDVSGVTVAIKGSSSSLGVSVVADSMDIGEGSSGAQTHWLVLRHAYVPPDAAVRSLCQARLKNLLVHYGKDDLRSVWARMKREHALIGLIEQRGDVLVAPPRGSGALFATLPLAAHTPFGLHVQADWLLDLARQGVRDVETNDWQRAIVAEVPALVALFLRYVASFTSRAAVAAAFKLLEMSDASRASSAIDVPLCAWKRELEDVAVWPVLSGGPLRFAAHADVLVLPSARTPLVSLVCPQAAHLLFGKYVLDRELVGNKLANDLVTAGVLETLDLDALLFRWSNEGLASWWSVAGAPCTKVLQSRPYILVPSSEQPAVLFALWNFLLAVLPPTLCVQLPCVLTAQGSWVAPTTIEVLECKRLFKFYESPSQLLDGELAKTPICLLSRHLPANLFPPGWVNALLAASGDFKSPVRAAYEWISSLWRKADFVDAVRSAFNTEHPDVPAVLEYTRWALSRSAPELITHVVADVPHKAERVVVPVVEALLTSPYLSGPVAHARDTVFASRPRIAGDYYSLPLRYTVLQWRQMFEELGACGAAQMETVLLHSVPVLPDYRRAKEKVSALLGVPLDNLNGVNTTRAHGWKVWDVRFAVEPPVEAAPTLLQWLEDNVAVFEEARGAQYAEGYDRRPFYAQAAPGSASWVATLRALPWVPCEGGITHRAPFQTPLSVAQSALSPRLLSALLARGLAFAQ